MASMIMPATSPAMRSPLALLVQHAPEPARAQDRVESPPGPSRAGVSSAPDTAARARSRPGLPGAPGDAVPGDPSEPGRARAASAIVVLSATAAPGVVPP